ncbi:hypothetical protein IMSHALPRED_003531 [Imshaugia aleurites]|uniref:Protein-S-isoprenylcysteine O-methyltransferase n=1 Tax=Imshaugia aleurites TaxID=172621 RepID=A0A8H3F5A3_9LECA|nr:hypothetical protein IMSHALPRED_003531 [Imshaugia aleurites]
MATPFSPQVRNPTHRNPWEPQTEHSNGHPRDANLHSNGTYSPTASSSNLPPSIDSDKNPAAISLRSFALGATSSASLLTTLYLCPLFTPNQPTTPPPPTPLWRLPLFLLLLSLFHYLEYHTTALSNPSAATVSAFLLSSNGKAYNIAHGLAFVEAFVHHHFFPGYTNGIFPPALRTAWLVLGAGLLVVGQSTRTTAMLHAGTNFNHLVQSKKKEGHVLVTGGVYRYLRHPSYFGFFWWGLGTQVVLGNAVCLVGYAVVLWRFFRRRIEKEETLLIDFFGIDYVRYRDRTRVGIPFIP